LRQSTPNAGYSPTPLGSLIHSLRELCTLVASMSHRFGAILPAIPGGFLPAYLLSSTTSVNRRLPPSLPRAERGTNGRTVWDHACLEMSRFPAFWPPRNARKPIGFPPAYNVRGQWPGAIRCFVTIDYETAYRSRLGVSLLACRFWPVASGPKNTPRNVFPDKTAHEL